MKQKFEYLIHDFSDNDSDPDGGYKRWTTPANEVDYFNDLGNDGWELVSIADNHAFFKREIPNE